MRKINTVLGRIDSDDLGLTLPHEHIIAGYSGWACDPLAKIFDPKKAAAQSVKVLQPIQALGVRTIVDATPPDLSRNVEVMKAVSEELQVHIVCSTGRYSEEEGQWTYLKRRASVKINSIQTELYEGFMQEITNGIGSSGVQPGVIKVATGFGRIAPCEEASFRAAAQASRETGLPIMTHTEDGTMGPQQADLLLAEGVSPEKIMIGHMCGSSSIAYHLEVLQRGVNIAFDRFGVEMLVSDQVRMETLIGLLGMGYVHRIVLSHDCAAATYGRGGRMPQEEAVKFKNWNFKNIFTNILPVLKNAGVSDDQIRTMMVDNPRRFLSGE